MLDKADGGRVEVREGGEEADERIGLFVGDQEGRAVARKVKILWYYVGGTHFPVRRDTIAQTWPLDHLD